MKSVAVITKSSKIDHTSITLTNVERMNFLMAMSRWISMETPVRLIDSVEFKCMSGDNASDNAKFTALYSNLLHKALN